MSNDQMKPGRFLKLQQVRNRFAAIVSHLSKGGRIMTCSYTKPTIYTAKHAVMFKVKGSSLYVQRGRAFDCLDFTPIKFSA